MAKKSTTIKDKGLEVKVVIDQLDVEVAQYLALKEAAGAMAVKMKDLKERIDARIAFEKPPFVDGELVLTTGIVKEVMGTPKLVWAKNGKSLTPKDREIVANDMTDQYLNVDLNIKMICQNADTDADLRQVLAKYNISQEQDIRLDVKALK
ncbi:hypothetical protein [Dyadobacter frigoris]|uniref:Uncharacterized protein n=1 Tax=Dyadobacter frigoris TaxID=2576211 RepID=A0A4U6CXG3_9BACT|nr:hypothetical protein [Dyadobacter frigoris]TKT89499.1 hypothetical protein FDK13_24460 [Dyadobacter frigoris]